MPVRVGHVERIAGHPCGDFGRDVRAGVRDADQNRRRSVREVKDVGHALFLVTVPPLTTVRAGLAPIQ
jgi:hypothetical protein